MNKIDLFRKISAAQVPDVSFLKEIGLTDIRYLPATLLSSTEDITDDEAFAEDRAALGTLTVKDLVDQGRAVVKDTASGLLSVEFGSYGSIFIEQFRADVNEDGIEEIVFYWLGYPIDGTLRMSGIRAINRTSTDGLFQEVLRDPPSELNV